MNSFTQSRTRRRNSIQGNASSCGSRRGVVLLEFIIVFPILLFSVVAIIELGRAIMVQQILTNAAREGARRAVLPETTNADVTQLVTNYLQRTSLGNATPTIQIMNEAGEPLDLATADPRDVVFLGVSVPYSEVGFGIYSYVTATNMGAGVQMRKEN